MGVCPGQVRGDEGPHDVAPELVLQVQDVMRDVQRPGHAARVRQVVGRAAAAGAAPFAGVVPELHREADDLVALLFQKRARRPRNRLRPDMATAMRMRKFYEADPLPPVLLRFRLTSQ